MKSSMVKVAVFRVVDRYTREDQFIIASMMPASKPISEAKTIFNECLAKYFACIAECEEYGPLPRKMAQGMIDAARREIPVMLVHNLLDEDRSAS